jgi:RNA polymerase sigma factor (sigma-70 family)
MGHPADDFDLLERYAISRDTAAFGELARRHVNLIYSAAARRVGDRALAEDVTQAVLMVLARRPTAAARSGAPLSAWLLTAVRYAAANALKIERRRRRRERLAAAAVTARGACSPNPSDALIWQEVVAELDDAVLRLPTLDRRAVLLRYFEGRPIRDVADALNVSEAAAKQRLSRSIEKLRHRLNRSGAAVATNGYGGIAELLRTHAVRAAPVGLYLAADAGAAGTATSLSSAKGVTTMMFWSKVKAVAALFVIASVLGAGAVVQMNRARAQGAAAAPPGPSAADVRVDKVAAVAVAAERLLDAIDQEMKFGNVPLTPEFVERKSTAQRRLAEARIEVATAPADRIKAAESLVTQCQEFLVILNLRKRQDVTMVQIRQGEYYLANAELLLAKLRTGG